MKQMISLAIVTCGRTEKLKRCLYSIFCQSKKPDRVIVIDNNPAQTSYQLINRFRKKMPILYAVEKESGAPQARNKAIRMCKTKYLGFVDDDCVLDKNWVRVGLDVIKSKHAFFVIGKTQLLNTNTILAQTQQSLYEKWRDKFIEINNQADGQIMDTKNIIIDFRAFSKYNLIFDPLYGQLSTSGFEDVDLGRQLNSLKLKGVYENNMLVYHEEVDSFYKFIIKSFEKGRLKYLYAHKWNDSNEINHFINSYLSWKQLSLPIFLIITSFRFGVKNIKQLFLKNTIKTTASIYLFSEIYNIFFAYGANYQKKLINHTK
jgi:GT2 family glycosyltransferase